MKLLYAASEVYPLAKTGGLGDVAGSLPHELAQLGADVRIVTPAYRGSREQLLGASTIATLEVLGEKCTIREGRLGDAPARVWLVDCPALFAREGDPYRDVAGTPFADNAWRFGAFSQAVARLALGEGVGWRCDVLHLNDWQTGLAPVFLRGVLQRPRVLFTIHNLAYQGVYGRAEYERLRLPPELWHFEALEFHGGFSFMKGGLVYADVITTVSPTYAAEIQRPEFGEGLDGLLRARAGALHGILNGIDTRAWDPSHDRYLPATFDAQTVAAGKRACKTALQRELKLPAADTPLLGLVTRFAHQKGMDLFIEALPKLLALPLQIAVLGSGDKPIERALLAQARAHPDRLALRLGYDEALAHRIEGGADLFLMASRYEPCGLNQMYSQRYGTIPVVRRVGGLADSVVDTTPQTLADGSATGVLFDHADAPAIVYGVRRALELQRDAAVWSRLQRNGMQRDFSWRATAQRYLQLIRTA